MELFLTRSESGFIATTPNEMDELKRFKIGETYKVKITQPRNLKFHKKFFAFIRFCFYHKPENMDQIQTQERMRLYIQFGVGHYDSWLTPGGKEILQARSISFAKMDETAFQDFYNLCTAFACKHILIGLTQHDIETELINFI